MKKELLKGFTMLALTVALALATAAASNAQSANKVVADIPFAFTVGDQSMPSGQYAVREANSLGNALMIQSNDAKSSVIRLTHSIRPDTSKSARLVFHRYGERYFLAEVWGGGDSTGRQLLKSRQERASERELASTRSKSDQAQSTYETIEILAALR
jgi:hypothetical protein